MQNEKPSQVFRTPILCESHCYPNRALINSSKIYVNATLVLVAIFLNNKAINILKVENAVLFSSQFLNHETNKRIASSVWQPLKLITANLSESIRNVIAD